MSTSSFSGVLPASADPGSVASAQSRAQQVLAQINALDSDLNKAAEAYNAANLRLAHTRRLLVQLVGLGSVSMDAWFEYVHLLFGELSAEVERLTEADPELRENYGRFLKLWGPELAEILQRP